MRGVVPPRPNSTTSGHRGSPDSGAAGSRRGRRVEPSLLTILSAFRRVDFFLKRPGIVILPRHRRRGSARPHHRSRRSLPSNRCTEGHQSHLRRLKTQSIDKPIAASTSKKIG
jgi:hypothetical protein